LTVYSPASHSPLFLLFGIMKHPISRFGRIFFWMAAAFCGLAGASGAQLVWQLAGGSASWPADKRTAIISAMNQAVAIYNANGYFTGTVYANYDAGVPTAQASYGGWIDFGGSISTRVALHELSHTQGVGTVTAWSQRITAGKWTGTHAINRVKLYDGASAVVNGDNAHFWPYGLNYDNEVSPTAYVRHVRMVSAMRRDMNIVQDSDSDGLPDDWEMFHFANLAQTATGDYDKDGSNNLAEYNADTPAESFSFTWNGGAGPWDTTTSRWTGAGSFWRNGGNDVAVFGGTAGAVTLASGISTNSATFNSNGYTLSGSGLTLSGWSPEIHTATGVTATIGNVISGSRGLEKTGPGTLVLNGANNFTGATVVSAGTLTLGPSGRLSMSGGSGVLTLKTGGTLSFQGDWGWEGTLRYQGVQSSENLIDGGTLRRTGPSNPATSGGAGRLFTVGAAGATLESGTAGTEFRIGYRTDYGETLASNGGTLTLTGVGDGDLSYVLPGSGGLTKSGSGRWTLKKNNTYTGATSVTGGLLEILGTSASSGFAISSGAVLELKAAAVRDYTGASFTGAGTLRKTGTATASWGAGAASFAMASGALIDVQAGIFTAGSGGNEVWTNNRSDLNVASGATFAGGDAVVRVDALNGAGTISSASTPGFTFGVDNGDGAFSGVLADGTAIGQFVKTGSGTQTLSGINTFTGGINIEAGALRITRSEALGTGAKTLTLTNGTNGLCRLVLAGGTGGINLPSTVSLTTSNQSTTFPAIINESGNNSIAGNFTLTNGGGATRIRVDAGALALSGNFSPNVTGRVLQLDGAGNGTLSGRLLNGSGSNIPSLSKEGTGTWTLTGTTHTYTGATTVNAGKLVVTGSLTTSGIVVANTATLAGTGTLGATTIQSGGRIAPGGETLPGTLQTGNLTLQSGSSAVFRLGSSSDRIQSTGNLSVAGQIHITDVGIRSGNFLLMSCTGTLNTTGMSLGSVPAGWTCVLDTSIAKQVSLKVSPASFDTWQLANITPAQISNPLISSPNATPAGDGISNLMKYALGLPAMAPSTTGITIRRTGGQLTLIYQRPAQRPDLTYLVEATSDLPSGSWSSNGVTHLRVETGDPETWEASIDISGSKGFLRLKVTR
jgi:autotransporter-associated beta strand protein